MFHVLSNIKPCILAWYIAPNIKLLHYYFQLSSAFSNLKIIFIQRFLLDTSVCETSFHMKTLNYLWSPYCLCRGTLSEVSPDPCGARCIWPTGHWAAPIGRAVCLLLLSCRRPDRIQMKWGVQVFDCHHRRSTWSVLQGGTGPCSWPLWLLKVRSHTSPLVWAKLGKERSSLLLNQRKFLLPLWSLCHFHSVLSFLSNTSSFWSQTRQRVVSLAS